MDGLHPIGTRHMIMVDGVWLHWSELGEGTPVVLLHGLCDSHLTWRALAPALAAAGYRVLLPDLPGHGLSGRPDASYALEWHAQILGRWLDRLSFERFALVGHSYGGGLAQQLLLSHARQVTALALVAPGGFGREVLLAIRALALPGVERLLQPLFSLGAMVGMRLLRRSFRDPDHRAWQAWLVGAPGSARAVARTARGVVGLGGQTRALADRLEELRAAGPLPPIAVFWGELDHVVPAKHARQALRSLPGTQVHLFEHCGHFPHLEQPAVFSEKLLAFFASALLAPIVEPAPEPRAPRGVATWLRAAWARLRAVLSRPRARWETPRGKDLLASHLAAHAELALPPADSHVR